VFSHDIRWLSLFDPNNEMALTESRSRPVSSRLPGRKRPAPRSRSQPSCVLTRPHRPRGSRAGIEWTVVLTVGGRHPVGPARDMAPVLEKGQ